MPAWPELDHLRLLRVAGTDRESFLQGQLTQDVRRAGDSATVYAGWADARGRLLWAGHLFAHEEALCLLVPAASAETLLSRLRMYVLRSRVTLDLADRALCGVNGHLATSPGQALRLAGDPGRTLLVGPAAMRLPSAIGPALTSADWRLADIRAGLPEILPATTGEFVPQMVNLDLLDGISFEKGCYTGQEIVARTRYLGRVKRRMLRFSTMGAPPVSGSGITNDTETIGQVVSAVASKSGCELLAVLRLEAMASGTLRATTEQPLTPLSLPYRIPELAAG